MKILIINDCLSRGGKERRLVELLKGLSKNPNISIELILLGPTVHYNEVYDLDIKIHVLVRRIKKDPSVFIKFYKICKNFNPDILHTWGITPTFYTVPISILLRKKIINSMITNATIPSSKITMLMHQYYFKFSHKIIANSEAGLKAYNAPKDKSEVIYNGFDFKRIENLNGESSLRQSYNITTNFIVGMVANFTYKKDYETFIKAALDVINKRSDVTFIAIGDGELLDQCRQLVTNHLDRIYFLGNQQKVETLIREFTIGVLTSNRKYHEEGISNSVMEYMSFGMPVIVSKGGGNAELVIQNKTGFIIDNNSVEELTDKINYLLDNPQIRKSMGEVGKIILKENFNIQSMIDKFSALYENTVQNK